MTARLFGIVEYFKLKGLLRKIHFYKFYYNVTFLKLLVLLNSKRSMRPDHKRKDIGPMSKNCPQIVLFYWI